MCFLFYRILVQSTPAFLPGEFRGQRRLASYRPLGCRVGPDWATFTSLHWCSPNAGKISKTRQLEATVLCSGPGSLTASGTRRRNAGPPKGSPAEPQEISKLSHHSLRGKWTRSGPGLTKTESQLRTGSTLIESTIVCSTDNDCVTERQFITGNGNTI